MGGWWLLLLVVPALLLVLYQTGLLSVQVAALSVGWNWGMPRWWRGQYLHLSGRLVRRFRPGASSVLRISVAGEAGSLSLEIADRTGAVRYAWYGAAALDTWAEIGNLDRFSVCIRGEGFRGSFALWLEP